MRSRSPAANGFSSTPDPPRSRTSARSASSTCRATTTREKLEVVERAPSRSRQDPCPSIPVSHKTSAGRSLSITANAPVRSGTFTTSKRLGSVISRRARASSLIPRRRPLAGAQFRAIRVHHQFAAPPGPLFAPTFLFCSWRTSLSNALQVPCETFAFGHGRRQLLKQALKPAPRQPSLSGDSRNCNAVLASRAGRLIWCAGCY